jgi:hypothetical protein
MPFVIVRSVVMNTSFARLGGCIFIFVVGGAGACDLERVRVINQNVDWAVAHWNESEGVRVAFRHGMRKLLELNRQGCSLPASDPDSVLFRTGQADLSRSAGTR